MASIPVLRSNTALSPTYPAVVRTRTRPVARTNGLAAVVAFLGLTYVAYSAASLAGSVLAEQARRDGLNAIARSRVARSGEAVLAGKVEELKSPRSIDQWAARNGFVAADRVLDSSLNKESAQTKP